MVIRECDRGAGISLWFYILTLVFLTSGYAQSCRLETCLNEYSSALEQSGIKEPESTAAYCQLLKVYGSCVKSASRSCRGDLQYHTTWSIITTLTKRFNCSRFRLKPQRQECSYLGRQEYSYCTLYGRPHLLTFSALYRNCKFQDSSVLVDNQFFSVIVTRGKFESSLLSQINVTINSGGTPCASEKQYIANAYQQLPSFFVDHSQSAGLKNSIQINSSWEGMTETVQIFMRYIDTTIIIKKFGSYFGFSCRMPSDILNFETGRPELCRSGCPDNEILDVESARVEQQIWRNAMEKCSDYSKFTNNAYNKTSWRHRDWCLFDVMSAYPSENEDHSSSVSSEDIAVSTISEHILTNKENNEIDAVSLGMNDRPLILTIVVLQLIHILHIF